MVGNFHGIKANMVECKFVLSKLELQLCYSIHFQTNTIGKIMNLLNHSSALG